MPKLVLRFDDRILNECGVGLLGVTIGRLPDNTIVIDNPAVSGHHARVVREGDAYVIEDLESTNGTFVNEAMITRRTLSHGDIVLIGKHTLVFDQTAAAGATAVSGRGPSVPELGGTRVLDTEQHRALLAKWEKEHQAQQAASGAAPAAAASAKAAPPTHHARVGVLRVLAGRADHHEYSLVAQTSMIGKADTALIRLRGWFKPKLAAAIGRKGEIYSVTSLNGKTLVNGHRVTGRQELKDCDVLQVGGLTLEFRLKR